MHNDDNDSPSDRTSVNQHTNPADHDFSVDGISKSANLEYVRHKNQEAWFKNFSFCCAWLVAISTFVFLFNLICSSLAFYHGAFDHSKAMQLEYMKILAAESTQPKSIPGANVDSTKAKQTETKALIDQKPAIPFTVDINPAYLLMLVGIVAAIATTLIIALLRYSFPQDNTEKSTNFEPPLLSALTKCVEEFAALIKRK